jgi:hypothetical protein
MGRLEYDLTNDDYIAFNRHLARTSPTIQAQLVRAQRMGGFVTLGVGAALVWLLTRNLMITVIAVAAVTVTTWFMWSSLYRRTLDAQLKRMARTGDLGRLGATVLTWDENGLTESAADSQAIVGWPRLQGVEETDQHLFLMLGDLEALVVPRRAGAEVAALAAAAQTKLAVG